MIANIPLVLVLIVAAFTFIPGIKAENQKYNLILVLESEGCKRMLENNVTGSCPSIDQLIPFDTSNQAVSGKFFKNDKGVWERENPHLKNSWLYYQYYNHKVVCVECNFNLFNPDLTSVVFIEPSDFVWIDKFESVGSNHTYSSFHGRYVTPDCLQATLAYSYNLMADTIYYINSGCTKTSFVNNMTMNTPNHFVNYTSSDLYLRQQWLKNESSLKTKDCRVYNCDIKDPHSNPNW